MSRVTEKPLDTSTRSRLDGKAAQLGIGIALLLLGVLLALGRAATGGLGSGPDIGPPPAQGGYGLVTLVLVATPFVVGTFLVVRSLRR